MTDQRLQNIVSSLLITGVVLSAAVVLIGGVCHLARHGSEPADYRSFQAVPESYRSSQGVIESVGSYDCHAVIQLGLLLLIATPVARVALSLVAFTLERDYTYVAITAVVLAVLIYSLMGQR